MTDPALEETFNKEGKTSLPKGISQSTEVRNKYIKKRGLEAIVIAERNEVDKKEVPKIATYVQKKSKASVKECLVKLIKKNHL